MASGSSSPAEPAGFRIERRLGEDVWEATQVELSRRVALRRLPPGTAFDAGAWPHRDGVVGLYAAVEEAGATYVATRFVPGARTLAEVRARPARRRGWLDAAATILDGAVHGDLTEHDILVDAAGRVHVTGFGRAGAGASAADDRAALARMRPAPRRRARAVPIAIAAVLLAAAALVRLRDEDPPAGAPRVTAGATAIGSALAAAEVTTVDCAGAAPSGSSPACTILPTALPGRPLRTRTRSLVRGWAVRGVSGRVRLAVVRGTADGFYLYNRSRFVTVTDPRHAHSFRADLSAPAGARFALEVSPGGGAGVRTVAGAATTRFVGPLDALRRRGDPTGGRGQELLLRVDVVRRPG